MEPEWWWGQWVMVWREGKAELRRDWRKAIFSISWTQFREACGGFPQVFFMIPLFCRFYSIKEKRKIMLFPVSYNHLIFSVLMFYLYLFYCSIYRVRQMSVNRVCSLATTYCNYIIIILTYLIEKLLKVATFIVSTPLAPSQL